MVNKLIVNNSLTVNFSYFYLNRDVHSFIGIYNIKIKKT